LNDLGRRSVTEPLARGLDLALSERYAAPLLEAARLRYGLDRVVKPGSGARWSHECRQLASLAAQRKPILLVGGSLAGRQALARGLHHLDPDARVFLVLDCPGLGRETQTREILGTAELAQGGAPAGGRQAAEDWPGLLAMARGGSLFLAGIEHLDLGLQQELVSRIAESGEDPRWIAGMAGDPQQLAREGLLDPTFVAAWTRVNLSPAASNPPRALNGAKTSNNWSITEDDPISLEHYDKKAIMRAIDACEGDKQAAARLLRLGKSTMYRKVHRYGIP